MLTDFKNSVTVGNNNKLCTKYIYIFLVTSCTFKTFMYHMVEQQGL